MDKYKILSSEKNYNNLLNIIELRKKETSNETELNILESYSDKKRFNIQMDLNKFIVYLDIIETVHYRNDADVIFNDILNSISDIAQINTLKRIIEKKPYRQFNIQKIRNCPHCNKKNIYDGMNTYVICGYTSKGYDWKGCGKDWCFQCGKKLCKSWNNDMLFNKFNRTHNSKCCKHYALKLNDIYPDNYCMCKTEYTIRD